ncbi:MAG: acetate/propionate family kinase [Candidatus Margulisiibacteriota bacterium]|jgi:acetate kinase
MDSLLVINSGSSSIKFSLFSIKYDVDSKLKKEYSGMIDKILLEPSILIKDSVDQKILQKNIKFSGEKETFYEQAIDKIMEFVKTKGYKLAAAGHRIVHGGPKYSNPTILTNEIIDYLFSLTPIMPLHQPYNLEGVKILQKKFPTLLQIGCFDTGFHATCNPISQHYALPKEITDAGVRRYGFHGLSYEYIASQLPKYMSKKEAKGKFIIAHLGNGATMCAVKNQKSVATSIGFTGVGGLPMGTRPDSLDPGVMLYLMNTYKMDTKAMNDFIYKKCGLLGVSGISSDMRTLLESNTADAKLAIDIFVHRITLFVGSLAAELEGFDSLIFTGGIGENASLIREMVCKRLKWWGILIDKKKNADNNQKISTKKSKITVWVIPTNEELIIANHTLKKYLTNGKF